MKALDECLIDIQNSEKIAIITHLMPDADALASCVALKKLIKLNLTNEDKIIDIFFEGDVSGKNESILIKGVVNNLQRCHNYNLAISLDCANASRMGKYQELFNSCEKKINIDHHVTNDFFGDVNLVMKTSSTCEGLYLIFKAKNFAIPDDVCSLIYSGIITDTNNLSVGTVTMNTHKVIAEIIDRNINTDIINEHFFKNNTKSKSILFKKALNSLRFLSFDRIAFMKISYKDMEECDATFNDTLGIVNHGIEIKGVLISVLAVKTDENNFYVSLRGKNDVDVSNIAKAMNGGGHEQCAAFQFNGELQEMSAKLLELCNDELDKREVEQKDVLSSLFIGDESNEYEIKNKKTDNE